jgi:hypothetical protein
MITPAKITLSAQEQQLVENSEWILTKRRIIEKVYLMFGDLSEKMKAQLAIRKEWLPAAVIQSEPKIYKGENYRQLPYVLLDYPRCFSVADIFAIRTFFWWGHFFSITIQLSGRYKDLFATALVDHWSEVQNKNYLLCVNADQWQHHFEADNYTLAANIETIELERIIEKKPFIKLALPFSLQQWDDIPGLLESSFVEMLDLLHD